MNAMKAVIPIIIVLVVIVGYGAFYIVNETEQVIITQFGKPVGGVIDQPGLHVKLPFIQKVNKFEKRLLEWDGYPSEIPTKDKRFIYLDTFARWRIVDPLLFLQSVGSKRSAHARLDDIIDSAARDAITSYRLIEVVRNSNRPMLISADLSEEKKSFEESDNEGESLEEVEKTVEETEEEGLVYAEAEEIEMGRSEIMDLIQEQAEEMMPKYGINLVDVRIKRINYVENVRRKVYDRMISERMQVAEKYRSEGQGMKERWIGKREKDLKQIYSEAYKKAEKIRGDADAQAIRIYAEAYEKDPDFYSFYKTLETYNTTLSKDTTLIMSVDSDYYKYLKGLQ